MLGLKIIHISKGVPDIETVRLDANISCSTMLYPLHSDFTVRRLTAIP